MSTRRRVKAHQNLHQQIWKQASVSIMRLVKRLLRSLLIARRRARLSKSGFVLPTAMMVSLVVILLTSALLIRSFERSQNATSVRVNQAVLNAATPALERARAKIDQLFVDSTLPQSTPSDSILDKALASSRYTFGDETRLKLVHDIDQNGTIQANTATPENNETLTTAWKFPADTDNNGKFDSYTLYGIYFRSPTRDTVGKFNRARNPLEARIPPMDEGEVSGRCATALSTSTRLIGDSDWYSSGNKLTKSFFVYTATVPITDISSLNNQQYEQYKGNKGFSALELQQDRVRVPLSNHAVWYEDDIEVTATSNRINGKVFTNSNLMVAGKDFSHRTIFYQVSDPDSCYYRQENSKIVVAGNIANGNVQITTDEGQVEVHRFQGKGIAPGGQNNIDDGINSTNKTTTEPGGKSVGYNNKAYGERISLMVQAALDLHPTNIEKPTVDSVSNVVRYPQEVKERFFQRLQDSQEEQESWKILTEELENYLQKHTRRVPYAEVDSSVAGSGLGSYNRSNVLGYTNPIRPPDAWMTIEDPVIGSTSNYTNLPLNFGNNNTMNLQATEPTQQQKDGQEHFIGDRISVGNNLPFFWPKYLTNGTFDKTFDKFAEPQETQIIKNGNSPVYWNNPDNSNATDVQRTRQSQIQFLSDLDSVERGGFWEKEAAKQPTAGANTGGLRAITGAGVYIDGVAANAGGTGVRNPDLSKPAESFLAEPTLNQGVTAPPKFATDTVSTNNDNLIVWSDSTPMWMPAPDGTARTGDLRMRATAVYHYKQGTAIIPGEVDPNQLPIACVSSYYDPTNETTARNLKGLPDVSGISDTNGDGLINSSDKLADGSAPTGYNNGNSNNGVTYDAPYMDDTGRMSAINTYRDRLDRQARMIFPNGRVVNEALRKALTNIDDRDNVPRTLADNAAIDTAICALKILDGTLKFQGYPIIPHGAIKEAAFLDSRQVKSLNNYINPNGTSDNTKIAEAKSSLIDSYTLPLEQRQPLEVRVTELDLNLLRKQEIRRKEIGFTVNNIENEPTNDQEYLLPNSGIIYATRDDALVDASDSRPDLTAQKLVSPTDFKLDSSRRPNGIRLINGAKLARKDFYRFTEKGLILATNLPTYIKGNFNLHEDPSPSISTVREEFEDKLDESNWNDFYTRDNVPNLNFGCRQNQPGCRDSGDQWRQATIISDAHTLLSNNFWDGFRHQGDYDLNNNQGNSAVGNRLKEGFWNNNFVTSANWAGSDGFPGYRNSYLTNGVTPIQRRANFPEYVMEICRKLPVTECRPRDWVIGYDDNNNGTLEDSEKNKKAAEVVGKLAERLGAGTTAKPALDPVDRRYARRVAFQRDSGSGRLEVGVLTIGADTIPTPTPLGIDASNQVKPFPYENQLNIPVPRLVDNALWFRTTSNTSRKLICTGSDNPPGHSCTGDDRSYAKDKPLFFDGSTQLTSRPPDIPGINSLNNSPISSSASSYTVCTVGGGSSKSSPINQPKQLNTTCGQGTLAVIQTTLSDFLALNPNSSPSDDVVEPIKEGNLTPGTSTTFTSNPPASFQGEYVINVINLDNVPTLGQTASAVNKENNKPTTIQLVGNEKSIFVFKKTSGSLKFGPDTCNNNRCEIEGVSIDLNDEVDPDNVFWAINGDVQWNKATSHQMKGNFLIKGNIISLNNVNIEGRLLGSTRFPTGTSFQNSTIKQPASTVQPHLEPILQIHSPTGTTDNNPLTGALEDKWMQVATTTTANAAFVTGDSPSRPNPSESGGGLFNLVRFLENWSGQTARISGSFIQHRRSAYSSAPFNPVNLATTDSLFYTSGSNPALSRYGSDTDLRYRGGESERGASFFTPPLRSYSFDVALLSQSPDLFAQRFTANSPNRPSEYFREVGRNDSWIQTLLCAAQRTGISYTHAIDTSERPTTCPSLTSYNDQQPLLSEPIGGSQP